MQCFHSHLHCFGMPGGLAGFHAASAAGVLARSLVVRMAAPLSSTVAGARVAHAVVATASRPAPNAAPAAAPPPAVRAAPIHALGQAARQCPTAGHQLIQRGEHRCSPPAHARPAARAGTALLDLDPPPPRTTHTCPACGQRCVRPGVFERHLGACCPDLVPRAAWRAAVAGGSEAAVLATASAVEAGLRAAAVRLAFKDLDPATGGPVRRSAAEVAAVLNLPVPRVAASLKLAMRAVPLAADDEPVEVLFEDAHLIAFAKPAGLITAPKHRYTGGSLVNRAIAHLGGVPPYPVHRLDMFTSGVVVMAKNGPAAAALHAQFRDRTAVKRYVALVVGRVGSDGDGRESISASPSAGAVTRDDPSFPAGGFAVDSRSGGGPATRSPGPPCRRTTRRGRPP